MNTEIANTILNQLGGKEFLMMTGSKKPTDIRNGIQIELKPNSSKANLLSIRHNVSTDAYDVVFERYGSRKNKETKRRESFLKTIETFQEVYCTDLRAIFVEVTSIDY